MGDKLDKVVTDIFTENGTDLEALYYREFCLRNTHKAAEAERKMLSILADSGMNITEAKGCLKFVALRMETRSYIKPDE